MAKPKGKAGKNPVYDTPAPGWHGRDLKSLRRTAMHAARLLKEMLPPSQKEREAKDEPETQEGQTGGAAAPNAAISNIVTLGGSKPTKRDSVREPSKPLAPEFDRLLGGNDGIIDGLSKLAQLVIRLSDKERETRDAVEAEKRSVPEIDEQELDRRIQAELDLIAERKRAAGDHQSGSRLS